MSTAPDARGDLKFDLSLSGGGVRSSFFSLGVVLYLIDAKLRGRIASVSSVSGGSITNAVLATGADIATGPEREIRERLQKFARLLAHEGSFFGANLKRFAKSGLILLFIFTVLGFGLSRTVAPDTFTLRPVILAALEISGLILASWYRRRKSQILIYQRFLRRIDRPEGIRRKIRFRFIARPEIRTGPLLKDLPETSTIYIFCSTELTSGTPMFMTRTWSYCPAYGCALLDNTGIAEVVYASAAFPLVFPPLPLKVDPLQWSGGNLLERPAVLRLADGGIYNNLGTDWRDAISTASDTFQGLDRRFKFPAAAERRVIVNSSAPARVAELRGFAPIRSCREFARTITVMYENTVRPRLQQIVEDRTRDDTLIIDIGDTPLSIAEDIASRATDEEVKIRATAIAAELRSRPYAYWAEYNHKAARIKTTLESVEPEQAAQLLRHGYLSAAVACHSTFGSPGLEIVPDDRWFYHYVAGRGLPDVGSSG